MKNILKNAITKKNKEKIMQEILSLENEDEKIEVVLYILDNYYIFGNDGTNEQSLVAEEIIGDKRLFFLREKIMNHIDNM